MANEPYSLRSIASILLSFGLAALAALTLLRPLEVLAPPPLAVSVQDELALQAAIIPEEADVSARLGATLRAIDIRATLEDTARLRGELG